MYTFFCRQTDTLNMHLLYYYVNWPTFVSCLDQPVLHVILSIGLLVLE